MAGRTKKKLGDILVEMGAIDPMQLQSALGYAQQWGMPLGRAVVERSFCSRDDVLRALSMQTGYPVVRLAGEKLDPALAQVLPERVATQYRAVPLRVEGRRAEVLVVAFAAPGNLEAVDNVVSAAGKQRAVVHLAHDDEIEAAIGQLYRGEEPQRPPAAEPLARAVGITDEPELDLGGAEEPAAPAAVRMYGWREASMRALQAMIERGGVKAQPLADEELDLLGPNDVLVASTLGLQVALPPGVQVAARLIVCGVVGDADVADARALGAAIYLRPPFSTEQLVGAIQRVRR